MEDFRSRSCGEGRMGMEVYGSRVGGGAHPPGLHDLRCHSAYYVSYPHQEQTQKEVKLKKVKSSSVSSSSSKRWSLSDPEMQRKKRVATYKAYAVEGKVKGSFRKSFRWLKDRYSQVVHGRW